MCNFTCDEISYSRFLIFVILIFITITIVLNFKIFFIYLVIELLFHFICFKAVHNLFISF